MDTTTSVFDEAVEAGEADTHPKILIAGEHGAGKTHALALAGVRRKMLVAVFEGDQSIQTIRAVSPGTKVLRIKDWNHWRRVAGGLVSGEFATAGYEVFGLDSMTALQEMLIEHIERRKRAVLGAKGVTADKQGKGAKLEISLDKGDWGVIGQTMRGVFTMLRDLGIPVLITIRTVADKEDDEVFRRFNLSGQAKFNVGANSAATAYIYKAETGNAGETQRYAMFSGPENFPCRELAALKGIVKPDAGAWLDALDQPPGEGEDFYIVGAPMPGARRHATISGPGAV